MHSDLKQKHEEWDHSSIISIQHAFRSRMQLGETRLPAILCLLCGLFFSESACSLSEKSSSLWKTYRGSAPLIIARGGSSGLFPDQTLDAYFDALNNSISPIALFCDLQLTKDGANICRTGLDLGNSTTISLNPSYNSTQCVVNGKLMTGYFAIDYTSSEVDALRAMQSIQSRSPAFDKQSPIMHLEDVIGLRKVYPQHHFLVWLHVEYPTFFKKHKLDLGDFVQSAMAVVEIDYISSPEVAFLRSLKMASNKAKTKLILHFLDDEDMEPSTNVTYKDLLKNLKSLTGFVSGVLVSKNLIWPVNAQGLWLEMHTPLVEEAHAVVLEVFASGFVNDPPVPVYNYSFDPLREYVQFMYGDGDIVDGFLTDFPTTASAAIACFGPSTQVASLKAATKTRKQLVISHNGASGDYPGCTYLAYEKAIKDGVDYVDCPVQMTSDGVPICRESPDLLLSTDVSLHSDLLALKKATIPEYQVSAGVFSTSMTWEEMQSLKGGTDVQPRGGSWFESKPGLRWKPGHP